MEVHVSHLISYAYALAIHRWVNSKIGLAIQFRTKPGLYWETVSFLGAFWTFSALDCGFFAFLLGFAA
jgi:hypothetical protein